MRAVVQRVRSAEITSDGRLTASLERGLVVYVGIAPQDGEADFSYIIDKTLRLRIFEDDEGKLNRSVGDIGGEVLFVSNFTLYGDCRHGRRPSYSNGAPVEEARTLYAAFMELARKRAAEEGIRVYSGVFQADMQISQVCDGPVNLLLDSGKEF